MKKYTYLFLFTVTISALFSGGRLTSSDELSVFLTTESLVKRGELSINPELVANGILGRDGGFYSGVGIAQPVLSIPFFMLGDFAADIFRLSDPLRTLSVRSVVSLFNQFIAGLIAVVFFAFGLKLGYSKRLSLFLTLSLLFTTNLFPYLKSYMREPQLLLYLLTSVYYLYCFKLDNKPKFLLYSGILCGIALLTRLTSVITLPVLFLYLLVILVQSRNSVSTAWVGILKGSLTFAGPIVAAIGVNAILNYLQFGSITTMPYTKG